jgi:hypothetical protein
VERDLLKEMDQADSLLRPIMDNTDIINTTVRIMHFKEILS